MQPEKSPNPDQSLEWLEARLLALPPLAIPDKLEARLLAAIPVALPVRQRRRVVRLGLAGALAAACLLAVLAWHGRSGKPSGPGPGKIASRQPVQASSPENFADVVAWRKARRDLDAEAAPAFTWPLVETMPIRDAKAIPPDLLE